MAFTIASSVGASMSAATGRSTQGHLQYAVNQGAYWTFYLSSTQSLSALYSTNGGASWTAPSGSPFSLITAHASLGRSFAFAYANIASVDALHMNSAYPNSSALLYHTRFTLGSTWSATNSETFNSGSSATDGGVSALVSGAGIPVDGTTTTGFGEYHNVATNTDSGSSWTTGWNSWTSSSTGGLTAGSTALCDLGSSTYLLIADDGAAAGSFGNLAWENFFPTSNAHGNVFSSALTQTDDNAWGAVGRTTTDIHVVALNNNSNAYTHRRFNGSSWATGDAIGSLTYGTASGISLVTNGTSVWAAAIDSSKNINYNKWTSGGGWGGWTTLEAVRTNTPAYITGVYNPTGNEIMWEWTEHNGSNYDIIGSVLSLSAAGSTALCGPPYPTFSARCSFPVAAGWV